MLDIGLSGCHQRSPLTISTKIPRQTTSFRWSPGLTTHGARHTANVPRPSRRYRRACGVIKVRGRRSREHTNGPTPCLRLQPLQRKRSQLWCPGRLLRRSLAQIQRRGLSLRHRSTRSGEDGVHTADELRERALRGGRVPPGDPLLGGAPHSFRRGGHDGDARGFRHGCGVRAGDGPLDVVPAGGGERRRRLRTHFLADLVAPPHPRPAPPAPRSP